MDASSRVEVMPKMEVTGESGYSTCPRNAAAQLSRQSVIAQEQGVAVESSVRDDTVCREATQGMAVFMSCTQHGWHPL